MNYFWLLYSFISFLVALFFTFFAEKRFVKVFIFSLVFSVLASFWFKSPGDDSLVPIISIFLLESTILESNGFSRIVRPFSLFFLSTLILTLIFWRKYPKN